MQPYRPNTTITYLFKEYASFTYVNKHDIK